MMRVLGASSMIVVFAGVSACFAPSAGYGGSGWYAAATLVHATVQEPAWIAVSESAPPPLEPLGEWVWTGAGWQWMSSPMFAEPSEPLGDFDATVKFVDRVQPVIEDDSVRVTVVPLQTRREDQ
jgi:hypothetical protein